MPPVLRGHGFPPGPAVGEAVRDPCPGRVPFEDVCPLSAGRFAAGRPAPGGQPGMTELHLWLRHEARTTERRTPIVPHDARRLVESGVEVTVEESPQRIFPVAQYEAAGCRVAPAGSWVSAPAETVVVGLKELPGEPAELVHRHVYFGHAYKRQPGAAGLLRRFAAGGGALLDLEYLVDAAASPLSASGPATWAPPWPCSSTGAG
ncbi:hypothetical protein GCM10027074_15980 [Streptomyces deserti]